MIPIEELSDELLAAIHEALAADPRLLGARLALEATSKTQVGAEGGGKVKGVGRLEQKPERAAYSSCSGWSEAERRREGGGQGGKRRGPRE
eukprot:scaffold1529_cov33-Tisochrysis_lutea.AAC.5